MNSFITLSVLACFVIPMETAMNEEEWAEKTIQSMRTCANFPEAFDSLKFKKLEAHQKTLNKFLYII